jgi:hypothetical protein
MNILPPCCGHVYYIPQLTEEHKTIRSRLIEEYIGFFLYKPCFGCLPRRGASKTGVTYNNNRMTIQVLTYKSTTIHSVHNNTVLLRLKYITYHDRTHHSAALLPVPPLSPSPDPPTFRTASVNSRLGNEEGRLKT